MNGLENRLQLPEKRDGINTVRAQLGVSVAVGPHLRGVEGAGGDCLDFLASTGALDRYGEIIEPKGWKLDAYRKNPVFQNAHRYGDVLFTLGKATLAEVRRLPDGRDALHLRVEFATDVNPVAKVAYGLYQGGFLNAVSVGFIPIAWVDGESDDDFFRKYLEQELVEVSAVAVPANRDALKLGLQTGVISRGVVTDALEILGEALKETAESRPRNRVSQEMWRWGRELRLALATGGGKLRVES
jgi:HK97 family phage prohead protease